MVEAPFSSLEDLEQTYYGDGSDDGTDDGDDEEDETVWGEPNSVDTLQPDWTLFNQPQANGDGERWLILRFPDDNTIEAINQSAKVEEIQPDTDPNSYPSFPTEQQARDAHSTWLEDNPDEGDPDETEDGWSEWSRLRQVDPWWIYGREHQTDDRTQFMASSMRDGETTYLGPNGGVQSSPHKFDNAEALQSALEAYFQKVQNGDIPEDQRPSGEAPPTGRVAEESQRSSSTSGGPLGAVADFASSNPLLAGGLAVGGAYAAREAGLFEKLQNLGEN